MKQKSCIKDVFYKANTNNDFVKVCAPMVRYSKVQFRTLVKNYGVDLCFTPMVLADSFCQNSKARSSEFSTTVNDTPLVVQFAANNVDDFLDASKLVYPYADGVDLNCGCPQRWAMKDGYGCSLLSKPELVCNLVKGVRNNFPNTFSVSVKVRLLNDWRKTLQLCQQLEHCGVDFLTVHGRTPSQKSAGSINTEALKDICASVQIPVIANGGIKTLDQAVDLFDEVKCNGVMAASAILTNPAMFSNVSKTPHSCVKMWMDMKDKDTDKIAFQVYHHHLVFMLEKVMNREQKQTFNVLNTFESVDDYLKKNVFDVLEFDKDFIEKINLEEFVKCEFSEEITLKHSSKCRSCSKSMHYCICNKYDSEKSDGNFFTSYVKEFDNLDYMDSNMFDEYS